MSNPQIANCKRCNKLFKMTVNPVCPECIDTENRQYQEMFRLLQRSRSSGGMTINELSEKVGMSVELIEEYYLESKLGTAGIFLKFNCKACGEVMGEINRKGRYCVNCSEDVSDKAGVQVRSRQDIDKEEEKAKELPKLPSEVQKEEQAAKPKQTKRAGFIRNR